MLLLLGMNGIGLVQISNPCYYLFFYFRCIACYYKTGRKQPSWEKPRRGDIILAQKTKRHTQTPKGWHDYPAVQSYKALFTVTHRKTIIIIQGDWSLQLGNNCWSHRSAKAPSGLPPTLGCNQCRSPFWASKKVRKKIREIFITKAHCRHWGFGDTHISDCKKQNMDNEPFTILILFLVRKSGK